MKFYDRHYDKPIEDLNQEQNQRSSISSIIIF